MLAKLLTINCGYYTTTKGVKHPVMGVLTGLPNRKRAWVPAKLYGMPVPALKSKLSLDNSKEDLNKGKDEGAVNRMKEKGDVSKGKRNVNNGKGKVVMDKEVEKLQGKGEGEGEGDMAGKHGAVHPPP